MSKYTIHLGLALSALWLLATAPLWGQTNAPSTNAPSTNAPAATPPPQIAISDVVTQAQATISELQKDQVGLNPDDTLQAVDQKLPDLTRQIDQRISEDAEQVSASTSVSVLQNVLAEWQPLSDDLASAQKDLSVRVKQIEALVAKLNDQAATWTTTLNTAQKAKTPAEIIQNINQVSDLIATTLKLAQADQNQLYSMQQRVSDQEARVNNKLSLIRNYLAAARSRTFKQNRPALWNPGTFDESSGGIMAQERTSLRVQADASVKYLTDKLGAVLANLLLFGVLVAGLFWLRNTLRAHAKTEAALRDAAHVFEVPLTTALLLALVMASWLFGHGPALLSAGIGAIALAPAVIVIRRLIEPALYPLLYATVLAYAADQVRSVIHPGGVLSRFALLLELLTLAAFVLAALRSRSLTAGPSELSQPKQIVRAYLHAAFAFFIVAGFANIFGYIFLSILLSKGILESSYLAVIFYAGVRILDALALSALNVRPLSGLLMVKHHRDLLYQNTSATIRWGAAIIWVSFALEFFTIRGPIWHELIHFLGVTIPWGSMKPEIGSLLAFPLTVWVAFLLSRFIRFCLEEEVYPHLQLGRGIPYATSTMVHYTILVLGFFLAVKAGGGSLSQFSFLAGAFGVGLGFGLQNIFNNFVSGIILLFERPIKVGDMIQIDANTVGKVERIGIRASVIALTNGSEMIVPNGNLISNPVTNWTLSNCDRLIEIPVNVTSKVDPQHVLEILTTVARAHPGVIKNPAPQALLTTFGATLAFRLRAWIDSEEEWMTITSELSLAINAALAKENITMS